MKAPANLAEKLATFADRFSPRTVATYNNNDIMVAKLEGPFHWHKHDETDDFFQVLKGTLDIELRARTVTLNAGEVFVVVDSHRMIQGPLHGGLRRHVDSGGAWSWQSTDVRDYIGHRAHIEFTPDPPPNA